MATTTVTYKGKTLQIPPQPHRYTYVRAKVKVHEYEDGGMAVFRRLGRYGERQVAGHPQRVGGGSVRRYRRPPRLAPLASEGGGMEKRTLHVLQKPDISFATDTIRLPVDPYARRVVSEDAALAIRMPCNHPLLLDFFLPAPGKRWNAPSHTMSPGYRSTAAMAFLSPTVGSWIMGRPGAGCGSATPASQNRAAVVDFAGMLAAMGYRHASDLGASLLARR